MKRKIVKWSYGIAFWLVTNFLVLVRIPIGRVLRIKHVLFRCFKIEQWYRILTTRSIHLLCLLFTCLHIWILQLWLLLVFEWFYLLYLCLALLFLYFGFWSLFCCRGCWIVDEELFGEIQVCMICRDDVKGCGAVNTHANIFKESTLSWTLNFIQIWARFLFINHRF